MAVISGWIERRGKSGVYWIRSEDSRTQKRTWVEACYTDKRASQQKLSRWRTAMARGREGLVDLYAGSMDRPLTELLAEYLSELTTTGRSKGYVRTQGVRLGVLVRETGWKTLRDISAVTFCRWRAKNPADEATGLPKRGPVSQNRTLESARAWMGWCVGTHMEVDPLAAVGKVKVEGDIRRARRALTEDEQTALLKVVPDEHHVLYVVALLSGLRRNELKTLRWGDVRLSGVHPWIDVRAKNAKNRRAESIPLHPAAAKALKDRWETLGGPEASEPVFGYLPDPRTHRTILERADIAYVDDRGERADFHALRHTYVTGLMKQGVSPRVVMALARHSSLNLTTVKYTHAALFDLSGAVGTLPDPTGGAAPEAEPLRMTGTVGSLGGDMSTLAGAVCSVDVVGGKSGGDFAPQGALPDNMRHDSYKVSGVGVGVNHTAGVYETHSLASKDTNVETRSKMLPVGIETTGNGGFPIGKRGKRDGVGGKKRGGSCAGAPHKAGLGGIEGGSLEAWLDSCPVAVPAVLRAGILAMLGKGGGGGG